MTSRTAEETIKELHNELNEAKKNLDQFRKITGEIKQRAEEAHQLLERLRSNPNLSESQIFESANVPKNVQRLIKSTSRIKDNDAVHSQPSTQRTPFSENRDE
ncbi:MULTISPECIES: hypothetical protein [Bifidobacterium]|uniref:Uncharacterized protein n=2 Tax=Bifidobacterium TaxID=1678 RepID=A0A087CL66_9BIFI|nr:hypothetical protein [Bifidobacterium psychraerophilum]KFI84016.1 hypothetical protein BPSY_0243 [Bifidobacterium psychraerophilum]PKA94222.1 hypothetical protein A9A89_0402 [Bifidobacterium psychraerophilum DSM 22366]